MQQKDDAAQARWDKIYTDAVLAGKVVDVLRDNVHLLSRAGRSLDVACGLGANALFLAHFGLTSHAWDISPVAVEKLSELAQTQGVTVHAQARDIVANPPDSASFELIVVSNFLDRALFPSLINALTPGGLLFYQTYSRLRVNDAGPRNEAYRLAANELLSLCHPPLHVVIYREEGSLGDVSKGLRNMAHIVAQRPL